MDQDATWHVGRSRPTPYCARWGPSSPPQKGAEPPIFGPYLLWPYGWMDQDATLYGGRHQPKRYCVRWGPSSSPPINGRSPLFSAYVYCSQTARWMKMPLSTEVDLSPGHIVLDGDPAPRPPRTGHSSPPLFGPCLLWPGSPTSSTAELLFNVFIEVQKYVLKMFYSKIYGLTTMEETKPNTAKANIQPEHKILQRKINTNKSPAVAGMGDRLATTDTGRKVEGGCCAPLSGGGAESPSKTTLPGPRPISVPSGILTHPIVWPQYTNVTDKQTAQTTVP